MDAWIIEGEREAGTEGVREGGKEGEKEGGRNGKPSTPTSGLVGG